MGERQPLDDGGDGVALADVFFEEFHACRDVIEQILDHEGRPGRAARVLDQHLVGRGIVDAGAGDAVQLVFVVRDAGAETTHGEARTDHQRVAELLGDLVGLLHDLLEEFAVLATIDGVKGRADQLDVVLLEHARLAQRHGRVQRGLSAQRRQQRVRTFLGDDLLEDRGGDRLDVGGVGHFRIGHDGGRVGIDQNDPNALFAQHAAGLGARIIEFRGLADHDRTGADDHHGLDVCALRHCGFPP